MAKGLAPLKRGVMNKQQVGTSPEQSISILVTGPI
jgi:hypothetical protein